ncbi:MAG: hypothetical protein JJT99_00310 [Rhodobacteraceae bacterium]|nr:hypothetical protein [Paracoccaceae bacterium]
MLHHAELSPPRDRLADILHLRPGRAHEFCGPARRVLAAFMVGQMGRATPVIWLRLRWHQDRLYPMGLCNWASPEGLVVVEAARETELLACAEDCLRSGAVALVVAELDHPPTLTPLRRLHLAAAKGLARQREQTGTDRLHALVLTPDQGGASGVESRWHLAPCPAATADAEHRVPPAWVLKRLRARMAPPAIWAVGTDLDCQPLQAAHV